MQPPRVLVGSPVTSLKEYCVDDYLACLKSFTYKNVEFLVLDNSPPDRTLEKKFLDAGIPYRKTPHLSNAREMLVADRTALAKKCIDEGFDFWLSLEQDIVCTPEAIEQLLLAKKEIVSAAYFNFSHEENTGVFLPDMFVRINPNDTKTSITRRMGFDDLWPSRLIKIFVSGFGCMLFSRHVLTKIPFHIEEGLAAYDDVFFCRDANNAGFGVYLDSHVLCVHQNRPHSKELKEKLWSK